jgi:hypothetical protein
MIGDQFGQFEDEEYIQQELINEQGQETGQELMDEQEYDIGQGQGIRIVAFC